MVAQFTRAGLRNVPAGFRELDEVYPPIGRTGTLSFQWGFYQSHKSVLH